MYFLLTEHEGFTRRISLEIFLLGTEESKVPTRKTEADIIPVLSP